jgi:hypothetical protein
MAETLQPRNDLENTPWEERMNALLQNRTAITFQPDGAVGVHIPKMAEGTATEAILMEVLTVIENYYHLKNVKPEGTA